MDKIAENSKFIETERKKLNLKIDDISGVDAAEAAIRAKEPPFLKYYESWKKIHIQQQAKKLTNDQTVKLIAIRYFISENSIKCIVHYS